MRSRRIAGRRFHNASPQLVLGAFSVVLAGAVMVAPTALGAPNPQADVALTVATSPIQPNTLEPLRYAFTVKNNGPSTATSAEFSAWFPYDPFDIMASQGACGPGFYSGSIRCQLGDLRKGAAATVEVSVQPTSAGTKTAYAGAWSAVTDPDDTNDSLTVNTPVRWGTGLPASCSGTVILGPTNAYPGCTQGFSISEAAPITLELQPGPDFTGDLAAYIYGYDVGQVARVHTRYLDGQPVGDEQEALNLDLPAGDWQLYVRAGDGWQTPSELCLNPVSGCYYGFPWRIPIPIRAFVQTGSGSFGASVSAR